MTLRIGVIGLGRMGAAMAARLIERGHAVSGWNRTIERAAAIDGLAVKGSPADVVAGADTIIVSLLDEDAAEAIYRGSAGLLATGLERKTIVDMSTLKPADMQANADAVAGVGGFFVACPVGGTVGPARSGKLLGLAGGDPDAIDRVLPVLEALCERIERFDTPQAASAVKLAINLPLLVAFQALGEAALLTRDFGVDQGRLVSIIAASPGGAPAIGLREAAILGEIQGRHAGPVGFSLEAVEKDLRLIDEVGRKAGFDLPVAEAVRRVAHDAVREGWSDRDLAALAAFSLRA